MGTVLSLSPSYRKAVLFEDGPATVGHYTAVQNSKNAKDAAAAAKSLKRPSIINVLPWKRIVAVSAKRKGSKKLQSDGGDSGKGSSPDGNATAMTNSASNSLKLKKSQSCANLSSYSSGQDPSATSTTTSSQLPTSKTLANVVTVTAKKNSLTGSGIQPSTAAGTPKRVIVQVRRLDPQKGSDLHFSVNAEVQGGGKGEWNHLFSVSRCASPHVRIRCDQCLI